MLKTISIQELQQRMMDPIQNRFPQETFDYQTLLDILKDYSRPRNKISDLIRKKIIVRIKKGLYVLGDGYARRPYSKELLANLIYGPSYISLDFALQYHGIIPERVEAVTSVTTGRSRRFSTPLGLFIYRTIPLSAFQLGMDRVDIENDTSFLIATPEKAMCDKIREDRGIQLRSLKDMQYYLYEHLRISETSLIAMNPVNIKKIADRYRSGKIRLLKKLIDRITMRNS